MNHHGDANYEFPSRVIGKSTVKRGEKEEIHLAFIHSEDLRRKQRRKYIRVRVNFPVAIHQEIVEDRNVPIAVQGNMLDVSEGGCSFVAKHLIRSGVMVNMSFYLEDREMGNILAKIVHTHSSKEGFLHHVSFVELPDEVSYYIKTFVSRHARRRI
jgi:c-di-GMP-binding flagellar brake protein YcgR